MSRAPGKRAGSGARRVRGRSSPDGQRTIVYVLGSTRSGTSALRNAIAQTRFKGYGEGHMEKMLTGLIETVRKHKASGIPERGNAHSKLKPQALLRHLFQGYEAYLSENLRSDYLLDKTPSLTAIRAAPALNKLHTRAKFIHCARRHVDNVQSKLKKFPEQSFRQSCAAWASCNESWLEVRDKLGGNYLEFDFHELISDPEGISGRIAAYLELDETEGGLVASYLASQRPQAEPGRDLMKFLRLDELDWSEAQKTEFREICGPVGERLGYGYESYFGTDAGGEDRT